MTIDERITQFENVVRSGSADEMAFFSLGSAYYDGGRYADAGPAFQRVLALNPQHSMAHLMLGRTQLQTGHRDLAIETLKNGLIIAHRRGDLKPRNEMADELRKLGVEPPNPDARGAATAGAAAGGTPGFACSRCGGGSPLKERPFKGALGEKVLARVCSSCWQEWIRMGTKVINELRLPMYDPQAQEMYDRHMKEFLGLTD